MKRSIILGLVLMVGILTANDNSSAPDGFIPGTGNSFDSGTPAVQPSTVDNSMEANTVRHEIPPAIAGTDAFAFTVVNWSVFNWFGSYCRGLDVANHGGFDRLMSPATTSDTLFFINMDDGLMVDKLPLDGANTGGWGSYPYGSVNVNDYTNSSLFNSTDLGVSWTAYTNPSGSSGRGMDVDYSTSLVWETSSSSGIYSFSHLASTGTYYDVSAHIPEQMSGLAVYDNGGYHLLIVNTYNSGYAYFFDLDNNLNFLGAVAYPYESFTEHSYGLTYADTRGTFFWAYKDAVNTNCYLVEMSLDITSLQQSTWGDIKSSF